jgi:hypothetical protein
MKRFVLIIGNLLLAACAATPAVIEGPYLQSGPADRPLSEILLPSKDTCSMVLAAMPDKTRQMSRCSSLSAQLEYGFDAQPTGMGTTVFSMRDQQLCEFSRNNMLKKPSLAGAILNECHKL